MGAAPGKQMGKAFGKSTHYTITKTDPSVRIGTTAITTTCYTACTTSVWKRSTTIPTNAETCRINPSGNIPTAAEYQSVLG